MVLTAAKPGGDFWGQFDDTLGLSGNLMSQVSTSLGVYPAQGDFDDGLPIIYDARPNRGGRVKAAPKGKPPIPLPPGKNGEQNEWVIVPGTADREYGPRWQPRFPPVGGQPEAHWDPYDGWWSGERGDGSPRGHYDTWGNKINMGDAAKGGAVVIVVGGMSIWTILEYAGGAALVF
jgi:hypothetical protein